jgi:phosphodiesterase/alkaline phosphatase D-like protein
LLPVDLVEWAWSGGVQTTRATVVARVVHDAEHARLELTPVGGGRTSSSRSVGVPGNRIVRLTAEKLEPGTSYEWRVVVDGAADTSRGQGRLETPTGGAQSFTIVAGSCARTGSNGRVWDAMRREHPDLVLVTGDLFYEDIERNDVDTFLSAYDRTLTQPAIAALLQEAPAAYIWDDHDYGPNGADASSPSREAARRAYRAAVPHAKLGPTGPVAQAFTVGRVRFIMTDARSNRTDTSILGREQMEWFLDELVEASRTHALVVWVNSVPWIAHANRGADSWAGYPDNRRRIAETIDRMGIRNLVMVAGDAHMLAIDDGTHSGYAANRSGGFPLLQAAALDRPGSVKGGPYSEGPHPGGGQYGVVRVNDDGSTVTVDLVGKNWRGETLMSYRFKLPTTSASVPT